MSADLERQLRERFQRAALPSAPVSLQTSLGSIVQTPVDRSIRPDRRRIWGLLAVAAMVAAGGLVLLTVGGESPPENALGPTPVPTSQSPVASTISSPEPSETPAPTLPVRGTAQEIGTQVLMAPGSDGSLYVLIPKAGGSVLALLDASGIPRPGWPIKVKESTTCGLLLPVDDGSVRVVCTMENPEGNLFNPTNAFAFDSNGSAFKGWPVDLHDPYSFTGRMVDDELTMVATWSLGDIDVPGQPSNETGVVIVSADGSVRNGVKVQTFEAGEGAVGPDGIAYGIVTDFGADAEAVKSSTLWAVGPTGVLAGFPVAIDGIVSAPAFDAAGRVHVIVGTAWQRPTRTLVFDQDGRTVDAGSRELEIAASGVCAGIEGSCERPAPPLVSPDGTTFVVDSFAGRTTVVGVGSSGQLLAAAWPYRSDAAQQVSVICPEGVDGPCDSVSLAAPASGPGMVIFLLHAAPDPSVGGGSIIAIGPDGRVRPGWPVELKRAGAAFWSVDVGVGGTAYALAIEPESAGRYSASVLAIAPDSSVLYTTTIIEP